jgi:hypothetical protein
VRIESVKRQGSIKENEKIKLPTSGCKINSNDSLCRKADLMVLQRCSVAICDRFMANNKIPVRLMGN